MGSVGSQPGARGPQAGPAHLDGPPADAVRPHPMRGPVRLDGRPGCAGGARSSPALPISWAAQPRRRAGRRRRSPLPTKPSIAVLPFANLSGDPEQEYFADGMVVEIVEALSRSLDLRHRQRLDLSFKGKGVSAAGSSRQLGVRYVLEGSVRKAANRVRIGVQLIDAVDGAQIGPSVSKTRLRIVRPAGQGGAQRRRPDRTHRSACREPRASARPTENMGSYDLTCDPCRSFASMRRRRFCRRSIS